MAEAERSAPLPRVPARPWRFVAIVALVAAAASAARGRTLAAPNRDEALAKAFASHGLELDRGGVLWLEGPPVSTWRAAAGSVPVVARARTGKDEPHDIYLAEARLSPEGVLLSLGRPHDISETTAVDEQRPVGRGSRFAYADPSGGVRLLDLAGEPAAGRTGWTRLERAQAALTRLQDTGRLSGVARHVYQLVPEPKALTLSIDESTMLIEGDGRRFHVVLDRPTEVPESLGVQAVPESTPGNLVTWAVDRVRAEVGDEAMQYVKAIAFSALDVVKSGKEAVSSDSGAAEEIAEDIGATSLEEASQAIPVDPEIGFPPPPLEPMITPTLQNEGVWQAKVDDPFIHSLPGLPPTFVTTYLRSDRLHRTSVVFIAMWDPRLVELRMMAGVAEPKSATGATGPGTIPREPGTLRRVAAAMNAGFQALHGEFGMMGDGVVYLPPKPYAATIAQLEDGSTGFGTWPDDASIPTDMLSYRQNMTPMVIDGKFNPYKRTWWGGTPSDWEDKTHTVRTGMCQTKESFVAYFYGADLSPDALAQAMILARCHYGVALDMNAGHSGLEFYKVGTERDIGTLGRALSYDWEREGDVPDMDGWKFRARRLIKGMGLMNFPRYIKREGRDFFYLTLRHVLPGNPIATPGGKEGDGVWQTKGLPQHGFPYAVARTELTHAGRRMTVLRVDPRMLVRDARPKGFGGDAAEKPAASALTPIVLGAVPPGQRADSVPSLWFSRAAFAVGPAPDVKGALRLASATSTDRAVAALGVEEESGLLVYIELKEPAGNPVALADFQSLLTRLGCGKGLGLAEPWPILLGGNTDLASRPAKLPEGDVVVLRRQPGPGSRRIFEATPIVPFDQWYPLQQKRIRYFKKPAE
ncbi:MAG: hypothetical protein FJ096_11945 [Deltaproteobacteria bacterium]|nr:hypothetical protein [Deltaproteobacteria bacterium]